MCPAFHAHFKRFSDRTKGECELQQFNFQVDVYDPHADKEEVKQEYGINLIDGITEQYDSIILTVSHKEFLQLDIRGICRSDASVVFDLKSFLDRSSVDHRL